MHSISNQLNRYTTKPSPSQTYASSPSYRSCTNLALLNQKLMTQTEIFNKQKDYSRQKSEKRSRSRSLTKYQMLPTHPSVRPFIQIQERQRRKEQINKHKITSPAFCIPTYIPKKQRPKPKADYIKSPLIVSEFLKTKDNHVTTAVYDQKSKAYSEAQKQMKMMVFVTEDELQISQSFDSWSQVISELSNPNQKNYQENLFDYREYLSQAGQKKKVEQKMIPTQSRKSRALPPRIPVEKVQKIPLIQQTSVPQQNENNPDSETSFYSCLDFSKTLGEISKRYQK